MGKVNLKIIAFDENNVMTDIKIVKISSDGAITMEEAIGQPVAEKISKDKIEETQT